MAEFVLVHGAWHGAWCWDELIPELEARGHRAQAIDLPGMGRDETPVEGVTLEACAARVADAVRAASGKVWLVGHSMGGASISQAAEEVPDRLEGLVFLTAGLPLDGKSFFEAIGGDPDNQVAQNMLHDPVTNSGSVPPEHLKGAFYNLCSDAQVARARTLLRQWQPLAAASTPIRITPANYGRVPRYYIECLQDQALTIGVQRRMHQAAGVKAVATLDSDHSPFFSMPASLANALDGFVAM